MADFGDDAIYVWSITIIGLALPVLMAGYSLVRVRMSKSRLERLRQEDE